MQRGLWIALAVCPWRPPLAEGGRLLSSLSWSSRHFYLPPLGLSPTNGHSSHHPVRFQDGVGTTYQNSERESLNGLHSVQDIRG